MNQHPLREVHDEAQAISPRPGEGAVTRRKRRSLVLSSIGEKVLDSLALAPEDTALGQGRTSGLDCDITPICEEFLVCAGGLCIPTDGVLRINEIAGEHYVVGHSTWERCPSRDHAEHRLAIRVAEVDPHDLVSEALEMGDSDDDSGLWLRSS
ncbi:MAG: hypothetical protein ACI8W3_001112 [Myxococcota bacterium]|jgi:hypothetical protein